MADGSRLIPHAVLPRFQGSVNAGCGRHKRLDLGWNGADEVLINHGT